MFSLSSITKTLLGKVAAVLATAVLGAGVAAAANFTYPFAVKHFTPWRMGEAVKVDLMFKRDTRGLPMDVTSYWKVRDRLKDSAAYIREIGEDIYGDFSRQRFIVDGTIPSSHFEDSQPIDGAVSYTFGIFLRNNTDRPIIFELGGFGSNDPGIKDWHATLLWYGGPDSQKSTGKALEVVADSDEIFLEEQAGGRFVFPGEPVLPGEFMALEFNVLNRETLGESDRWILSKLTKLIKAGAQVDLDSLTAQLRNTIAVYKVASVKGTEGFDRVRVDMFLNTRPDSKPDFKSPLLAFSDISDVGEVGVKLHFADKSFWDRILKTLGSSFKKFTDPSYPFELTPDEWAATDPVSDFEDIVTDDGEPLGPTTDTPITTSPPLSNAPVSIEEPFTEKDLATFLQIANEVFYPSSSERGAARLKEMIQLKDGNLYVILTGSTADYSALPWWLKRALENLPQPDPQQLSKQWREVAKQLSQIPKFRESAGRIYIYVGYKLPAWILPTVPWMPLWPSHSSTPFDALLVYYEHSRMFPNQGGN